ncbi:MAG TPA: monofunctional biosynthetic peptidoglycan transglycosylase [Thermodesulfobacteriota bacterium]|nr:monofunctional biosynthetic peptidoglycan transglycosylase [Thermodesulfobacteriota bacterium]
MAKKGFPKFWLFLLLSLTFCSAAYFSFMPDISQLKKKNPGKTAFMAYREKEWKKKGQKMKIFQVWVPLSRISPYLAKAVLIGEDDKFWKHEGFDYESMMKAIEKDVKAGKFKLGGSTISQQLAKNLYLSPVKSPLRKIQEAIITWKMERVLSKRRILELYLNEVEWGEGVFGAEAAARHYFTKSASDLTPMEAAGLAAVLPNPRKYDPAGDQRYVLSRSNLIFSIMIRRGIVPPEYETDSAGAEENSPAEERAASPVPTP